MALPGEGKDPIVRVPGSGAATKELLPRRPTRRGMPVARRTGAPGARRVGGPSAIDSAERARQRERAIPNAAP